MWKNWNSHILLMTMYSGTEFLAVSTKAEHLQKHTIPFLGIYIQKICVPEYTEIHKDYSQQHNFDEPKSGKIQMSINH